MVIPICINAILNPTISWRNQNYRLDNDGKAIRVDKSPAYQELI